jgi:hypothetical protein
MIFMPFRLSLFAAASSFWPCCRIVAECRPDYSGQVGLCQPILVGHALLGSDAEREDALRRENAEHFKHAASGKAHLTVSSLLCIEI